MNDLKQKCLALGEALYEVIIAAQGTPKLPSKDEAEAEVKKGPGRPPKAKVEAETPKAPEPVVETPKAPEPVAETAKAPGPVAVPEPVKEESLDDLFTETTPKTVNDVKNMLMDWAKEDPSDRKPKAIGIFVKATGLEAFKDLSEANATEMFYKLEKVLKNYK